MKLVWLSLVLLLTLALPALAGTPFYNQGQEYEKEGKWDEAYKAYV